MDTVPAASSSSTKVSLALPLLQVSARAKKRGLPQMGTLGAGNHYAEIQVRAWAGRLSCSLQE